MDVMIACCGLNCAACEASLATKANDQAELEKIAEKWRAEYNAPEITAASVSCLGCSSVSGPWCSHCGECNIRACAQGKGLTTCAECAEYPCEELSGFLELVPAARENLESLRK